MKLSLLNEFSSINSIAPKASYRNVGNNEESSLSFSDVMKGLGGDVSSKNVAPNFSSAMLPGDYASSFRIENPTPNDRNALPQGMARSSYKEYSPEGEEHVRTIDKTSVLYEKALELESYFVKIMTDSMRSTLTGKTLAGDESFASKMYKDMMYDELNRSLTKNAGFGLADHIYLQLNR